MDANQRKKSENVIPMGWNGIGLWEYKD